MRNLIRGNWKTERNGYQFDYKRKLSKCLQREKLMRQRSFASWTFWKAEYCTWNHQVLVHIKSRVWKEKRLLKVYMKVYIRTSSGSLLHPEHSGKFTLQFSFGKAGGLFLETFVWEDGFGNARHISYLTRDVFYNHPT